ncbi:histidine ammonia-lyase [bacterium]|nr:histidine ammonia-lyase [bacterium]
MSVRIDGRHLAIEQVEQVARQQAQLEIEQSSFGAIERSQKFLQQLVDSGEAIYGVTTGIGEFARIRIDAGQSGELQRRIIYSHAAGTGDVQPAEVVRAAMACRLNTFAMGYSGIRRSTVETYLAMLNRGVVPVVYEKGSVGCSGDLSPLSQLTLVVIGDGEAFYQGERLPGAEAMQRAGLEPVKLVHKEGLALINGTEMMCGEAALQLYDTARLYKNALIAYAMALDALKAVEAAFDERVHELRPYPGSIAAAAALRALWQGSGIMAGKSGKVQDGYSMRCAAQIFGASLDSYHFARRQIETELNSAIDNPLFFAEDGVYIAAGNFHGQPVAMSMDFMAIATAEVASLAERHTNRLLNPALSNGLPDFLIEGRGLNSGMMVAQYTQAALISENRVLAHPAVVDNISVSADQEDHVNMGPVAVRKYKEILKNTWTVVAIEMYCAAQAMDFRKPLMPGVGTGAAYGAIRQHVPFMEDDRPLVYDIEKITELVTSGAILEAVEAEVGEVAIT